MISLIYGAKGSGKTKQIIDAANAAAEASKGVVVFVGDQKYSNQINTTVRFFDSNEYGIKGTDATIGFIKGILASNYDIDKIFIDGLLRITGLEAAKLKPVIDELDNLSLKDKCAFTLTVSTDTLPAFLKKYV